MDSVVTVSTTFTTYSTLNIILHTNPNMKKRDAAPTSTSSEKPKELGARNPQATAPPSSTPLPAFASMCTSTGTTTSRVASACSWYVCQALHLSWHSKSGTYKYPVLRSRHPPPQSRQRQPHTLDQQALLLFAQVQEPIS